jgi:hypothetical protein
MNIHKFKINDLDSNPSARKRYRHYMRRFFTLYGKDEKTLFSGHFETIAYRKFDNPFSVALHIGNAGSDSAWRGHFLLFGVGFFWGHTAFRKLANWLTRCSGYKYDTRDWMIRIADSDLWWECAEHDQMCEKHRRRGTRRRNRTWRRGVLNLSIPEAIWGPYRYSYEDVDQFPATLKMPEGEYAVLLKLQKVFYGRTKTPRAKQIQTWCIDVEAPKGIPTHRDHSGGWKGDRTYGFGVDFKYPESRGWQEDAYAVVTARVYQYRGDSGFREAQPVD